MRGTSYGFVEIGLIDASTYRHPTNKLHHGLKETPFKVKKFFHYLMYCSIMAYLQKMWHKENHRSMYNVCLQRPSRVDRARLTWHMESML